MLQRWLCLSVASLHQAAGKGLRVARSTDAGAGSDCGLTVCMGNFVSKFLLNVALSLQPLSGSLHTQGLADAVGSAATTKWTRIQHAAVVCSVDD